MLWYVRDVQSKHIAERRCLAASNSVVRWFKR
jgi:hypothetical protein